MSSAALTAALIAALASALVGGAGCYGSLATDDPLAPGGAGADDADAGPLDYTDDIAPLFATACVGCHSGAAPSGGYDTTSLPGLLAGGSDGTPNVIPGDPASKLVAYLAPVAGSPHMNLEASFPGLGQATYDWVVTWNAVEAGP